MADTTLCLILNLYRRTYWLANMVSLRNIEELKRTWSYYDSCLQVKEGKKITGPEQLKDAAFGCARIRGDTLGIVGLGKFKMVRLTPIYGPKNLLWRGFYFGSNYYCVQFSNSVVELKRDLHQQVVVISDLLSWLSAAKFNIGLSFPSSTSIPSNFLVLLSSRGKIIVYLGLVQPLLSSQPDIFFINRTGVH